MNGMTQNISLKQRTTFRIGGPARFYLAVRTENDLRDALAWANAENVPVFILGRGSNILVSDRGWPGLVTDMTGYDGIVWDGANAACEAGAPLSRLVREAAERGCSGCEELAGIPGSIGGALVMNAGAYTQAVSDCLVSVRGIDRADTSIWELKKGEIDFGYRRSCLKERDVVVTGARFSFAAGDTATLRKIVHEHLRKRTARQPLDKPNCGSVFKNPAGTYAAALIEECGLKGRRVGGAAVSEKHANFIVADPEASAAQVRELIGAIRRAVYEKRGILLEPEVIFVGAFDVPLFTPASGTA